MNLKPEMLERSENTLISSYCHVAHNDELEAILKEQYGRDGLCLKIFDEERDRLEDATWGKVPLEGCTVIQNLLALHNLAPRIYDIAWINDQYVAQVTDFLEDNDREPRKKELLALVKNYGIKYRKHIDLAPRNWIGDKYVDCGGMFFLDRDKYEQDLATRTYVRRGVDIGSAYQTVEELSIHGQRDIVHRSAVMHLDEIDFQDTTVLDIGCNLGMFCQDAYDRGAQRVFGIDHRDLPGLAREIANVQGYWNLDFRSLKLKSGDNCEQIRQVIGIEQYDIVYFMAVANYVGGYAPWVANLCRDILYVEGHGKEHRDQYESALKEDFQSVEFLGMTEDNYSRPLFRCRKAELSGTGN